MLPLTTMRRAAKYELVSPHHTCMSPSRRRILSEPHCRRRIHPIIRTCSAFFCHATIITLLLLLQRPLPSKSWEKAFHDHGKTIMAYYASWQWYDRSGLAKPSNLDMTKVTRYNFAFFQPNTQGDIWGTDSWADPSKCTSLSFFSVDVIICGCCPLYFLNNVHNPFYSLFSWLQAPGKSIARGMPRGSLRFVRHISTRGDWCIWRIRREWRFIQVSEGGL